MRPMILLSTVADGPMTRVNLEVFDQDGPNGEKCVYQFAFDSARHPESRPDWAAVYAGQIVRILAERLEQELASDGPSLSRTNRVRQATIQRTARCDSAALPRPGNLYM